MMNESPDESIKLMTWGKTAEPKALPRRDIRVRLRPSASKYSLPKAAGACETKPSEGKLHESFKEKAHAVELSRQMHAKTRRSVHVVDEIIMYGVIVFQNLVDRVYGIFIAIQSGFDAL